MKTFKMAMTPISVLIAMICGYFLVYQLAGQFDLTMKIIAGASIGLVIGAIGCAIFGAIILYGAKNQTDDDPLVNLNLDRWLYALIELPLNWVKNELGISVFLMSSATLSSGFQGGLPVVAFLLALYLCVWLTVIHIGNGVTKIYVDIMGVESGRFTTKKGARKW